MNSKHSAKEAREKLNNIIDNKLPKFAKMYFDYYMDKKQPRTLYCYALDLVVFFTYVESIGIKLSKAYDMGKITAEIIENYLQHISYKSMGNTQVRRSDATIYRYYASLSSFLNYYYKNDYIEHDPSKKVTPPTVPQRTSRATPNDDLNMQLLEFIEHGDLGIVSSRTSKYQEHTRKRDLAIALLLMGAGLGITECLDLNIDDLHLDDNYICLKRKKGTVNLYISNRICRALSDYLADRLEMIPFYGHENALFLSLMQYKRLSVRSLQQRIKVYVDALFEGQQHISAITFKEAFRKNLFTSSRNIIKVSEICGNGEDVLRLYYRAYIEDYEEQKTKDFT